MKLSTETIGDQKIEIEVEQGGMFVASFNDHDYRASTRVELLDQLKTAVKKAAQQGMVDVSVLGLVPTTNDDRLYSRTTPYKLGDGVVHAKLRSRHEREYNTYLLVSDAKQKFKVSGSLEGTIARRLTDPEVAEYLRLREALRVATTAVEDFVGAVKLNPDEALASAAKKGGD